MSTTAAIANEPPSRSYRLDSAMAAHLEHGYGRRACGAHCRLGRPAAPREGAAGPAWSIPRPPGDTVGWIGNGPDMEAPPAVAGGARRSNEGSQLALRGSVRFAGVVRRS